MSLLINVAQLLKEPVGSTRHHQIKDRLELESKIECPEVAGSALLTKIDRGVWVKALLATTILTPCSRCMIPFEHEAQIQLDDIFFPTVDINTGKRLLVDIEDDTDDLTIDEQHLLDLKETIRQDLISDTPMRLLCRLDCRGLCDQCGSDLNEGNCSCEQMSEKVFISIPVSPLNNANTYHINTGN